MLDIKKQRSLRILSVSISSILDLIGFNNEWTWERIRAMDNYSKALSITTRKLLGRNDVDRVVTGSVREGVGLFLLNDIDFLQIDHGVICGTDCFQFTNSGKLVFEVVQKDAPCGYCFLRLLDDTPSPTNGFLRVQHGLVQHQGDCFLSSTDFIAGVDEISLGKGIYYYNDQLRKRYGPSLRKQKETNHFIGLLCALVDLSYFDDESTDFVRAFPCKVDSFLQEWQNRDRPSGWPYRKVKAHVMNLPGYVVPVGLKGTDYEDLQWRICFTDAEIHLIQSLNCTQKKIYILLKFIAKHTLKPLSAAITSYVMKMVILWLAEKIHRKRFRRRHLVARLTDALKYLRECVQDKALPNYMIPNRNMFARKLEGDEQLKITEKLDSFLENVHKLVQEVLIVHILNTKHGQDNLSFIFVVSLSTKCISLHDSLYSTERLADLIESILQCESYLHLYFLVTSQFFKFFGAYGNRPMLIELTLNSQLQTIVKQQQYGHKQEAGGNKKMLKNSNTNENDKELLKGNDNQNKFKWIIPLHILITLYVLFAVIYTYFVCINFGIKCSMGIHLHVIILVLYQWFLDDKQREKNCQILSLFYWALAAQIVYKDIMICSIGGSLFKPFILDMDQEGNNIALELQTMRTVAPFFMDAAILQLNAFETFYFII